MTQPPATVSAPSAQACSTVRDAFERFNLTVTPEDRRDFSSTELKDVRDAALKIENQLAARKCLRNMRRLQPLFQRLEYFSKTIEVLCNGTPYLPWIWAPIKLMLQVSTGFLSAFEKLIVAYRKIADALPRFDRLSSALKHDHNFQAVLAFLYADILEFHRRAYKFVRRKSWKLFFDSIWADFDSRFNSILASLTYHTGLVDKEAAAVNISEAMERRTQETEQWDKQERERRMTKRLAVMSWLQVGDTWAEDEVDKISRDCLEGSCDWFIRHNRTKSWINDGTANALLWLYGKPGAGKSVLCSSLIQSMEAKKLNIFHYFCSYLENATEGSVRVLRSLAAQAAHNDPDLVVYIHDEFIPSHPVASRRALMELLPKQILPVVGSSRLIIDGIDEWDQKEQKLILGDILLLLSTDASSHICKILISSRDIPTISGGLRKTPKTSISLSDESRSIDYSVELFVQKRFSELHDRLDDLGCGGALSRKIQHDLVKKSNGMFLWVSLVLDSLESVYSSEELSGVLSDLPSDLFELYTRILQRVCNSRNSANFERASRILKWICFSQRPLNKYELLQGLALTPGKSVSDIDSVPIAEILEVCKPLIEERSDGTVTFVHFSVQEFLFKDNALANFHPSEAHRDILFACASTLMSGFELTDPNLTTQDCLAQVGNSLYRLLPYAIKHWVEHLFLFISSSGVLKSDDLLYHQLCMMQSRHNELLRVGTEPAQAEQPIPTDDLDQRLQLVAGLPIYDLVRRALQMRLWLSEQEVQENGQEAEIHVLVNDTTLFSRLAVAFQRTVLALMSSDSVIGLQQGRLDMFKRFYASFGFHCRYPLCSNSSVGFATDQLRTQHETQHFQLVFCKEHGCSMGFKNKNSRDAHMRKYHSSKAKFPIPSKIRGGRNDNKGPRTNDRILRNYELEFLNFSKCLIELDIQRVPERYKIESQDWSAIFNPGTHYMRTLGLIHTMKHPGSVACARFSSDGRYVASASYKTAQIFNIQTGELQDVLDVDNIQGKYCDIHNLCFSPGGDRLVIVCADHVIRVWDIALSQIKHEFREHAATISSVNVAGPFAASGDYDGFVYLWDLDSCQRLHRFSTGSMVSSVAISADLRYVAAGSSALTYIWNTLDGDHVVGIECGSQDIRCITFMPNNESFITGSVDGTIRIWAFPMVSTPLLTPGKSKCRLTLEGHASCVHSIDPTPDSKMVLSGYGDGSVQFWGTVTGKANLLLRGHGGGVLTVAHSPTEPLFVTGGTDNYLKVWRYENVD